MLHQTKWHGDHLTINIKPECFTLGLESSGEPQVFSYDLEGRCWTALVHDVSYRQGLDGKIIARRHNAKREVELNILSNEEVQNFRENARVFAFGLFTALNVELKTFSTSLPRAFSKNLRNAAEYDQERFQADARAYQNCYKPVGILPPDQYMSLVLQASEGCSFNTCTFCSFYKNRPFHIKTPQEFTEHVNCVKSLLGKGLSNRKTIFLGDANALVIPSEKLMPLMEITNQQFDIEKLGGIFAFLDGFSGQRKTLKDYQNLAKLGLRGAYIGLESGHGPLLKYLRKPGTPKQALETVRLLKKAGIQAAVIILLGAGGKKFASEHVRDSIKILNKMKLDMQDILYFSEFIEQNKELKYALNAFDPDFIPLSPGELADQQNQIEEGLRFSIKKGTPHISKYDIREFIY